MHVQIKNAATERGVDRNPGYILYLFVCIWIGLEHVCNGVSLPPIIDEHDGRGVLV